jgi:hypothetical protein
MHRLTAALVAAVVLLATVALARLPITVPAQAGPEFRTQPPRRSPAPMAHLPLVEKLVPTPTPTLTPTPSVTPTGSPRPPDICQRTPTGDGAPESPIHISSINKPAEVVVLQNVSANDIDLTGWAMCSLTGDQHHPIGGLLGAGATAAYTNEGAEVWEDLESDPGALYDPSGTLVSYYPK